MHTRPQSESDRSAADASTPLTAGEVANSLRVAAQLVLGDIAFSGERLEVDKQIEDCGGFATFELSIGNAGYRVIVAPISADAGQCECGAAAIGTLRRLYQRTEEPVCIACAGRLGFALRNVAHQPEAAR